MIANYFLIASRNLRKYKWNTLSNLLGLSIGLACCLLMLLFINHETSFDAFYRDSQRVYRIADRETFPTQIRSVATSPGSVYNQMLIEIPEIETCTSFKILSQAIQLNDQRFQEKVFFANPGFWDVFSLDVESQSSGSILENPKHMLISRRQAKKWFNDDDPLGRTLILEAWGEEMQMVIVGVFDDIPDNSHFHYDILASYKALGDITFHKMYTYVKINATTDRENVEKQINTQWDRTFPDQAQKHHFFLQPLESIHLHSHLYREIEANRKFVYIIVTLTAAIAILAIACINFVNLTTARARQRFQEIALRKIVGATKFQLRSQIIGEVFITFALSAFLASLIVIAFLPQFNGLLQCQLQMSAPLFGQIALFSLALTVVIGFVTALYPAFILSSMTPVHILKSQKIRSSSRSLLTRRGLVIFQLAISLVFISAMIYIYAQVNYLQSKDLGFSNDHVLKMSAYGKCNLFIDELSKHSAVSDITYTRFADPGTQAGPPITYTPVGEGEDEYSLAFMQVAYNFFDFFGIEMTEGRPFNRRLSTDFEGAVILNQAAADLMGWESALDRQLKQGADGPPLTVIGTIVNYHNVSLHSSIKAAVYTVSPDGDNLYIRYRTGQLPSVVDHIKLVMQKLNITKPLHYTTMQQDLKMAYRGESTLLTLFRYASILTCLIAALGLTGLIIFTAEGRIKEIAIRKILGSSPVNVLFMLLKEFVDLTLLAIAVSTPITLWTVSHWLENFHYRITLTPMPGLATGLSALLLILVCVAGVSWKSAVRNPIEFLRSK